LPNPKNDAEAIAKLLREVGFDDVFLKIDLGYRAMRESVRAFGDAADNADVALIYYAGHGLELDGENYLVPVDAKLVRDVDLEYEAISLASILSGARRARRLRVVILDACRNNPLGQKIATRNGVTRSVTRGLARVEPSGDVLVAFAAKAGTLAEDGSGKHSPFATALIEHMPSPGLDVRLMFGKVRDAVLLATHRRQEPFTYGSLSGDVVPLVPGIPLTKAQQIELMFWASVKDSNNPGVLSTYIDRYPNGEFAPIAKALIDHYEQQLKLELAKREEQRIRREAELKGAEAKRLEEERRIREVALAEERLRVREAKNAEVIRKLEERQKFEALATAERVQKLLEEETTAREAAKLAEAKRVAAAATADQAAKSAEEKIATKLDEVKRSEPAKLASLPKLGGSSDRTKLAALPKLEQPKSPGQFDGRWRVTWYGGGSCNTQSRSYNIQIRGGVITGESLASGSVSASGAARWKVKTRGGNTADYSGQFGGTSGSGRFDNRNVVNCFGTFTAIRN
jgi:hypothetical protein